MSGNDGQVVVPPTGWEYDRYYGYDVDPWLMNCSAIGDGSGGNVGVVLTPEPATLAPLGLGALMLKRKCS